MNRIKIINGYGETELQNNVDEWIEEKNPVILSTSIAKNDGRSLTLCVVYTDNPEKEIQNLLKS